MRNLIKINEGIFSRLIFENFEQSFVNDKFSHCLKQAKVNSVFKKEEKLDKSKFKLVSILPAISKIYERLMCKYLDQILSKFHGDFLKGLSTQNCLLYKTKNWKES